MPSFLIFHVFVYITLLYFVQIWFISKGLAVRAICLCDLFTAWYSRNILLKSIDLGVDNRLWLWLWCLMPLSINNISDISWQSVLLVEESEIHGENHQPVANHWQTFSHNVVSSTPNLSRIPTHNIGVDNNEGEQLHGPCM